MSTAVERRGLRSCWGLRRRSVVLNRYVIRCAALRILLYYNLGQSLFPCCGYIVQYEYADLTLLL